MRESFSAAAVMAFFLTGCSTEPAEMPDDLDDAAQFCVAAKMLSIRDADGRERGDPLTISQSVRQQAYPMIAASKLADFGAFLENEDLVNADQVVRYGEEFDPSEFDRLVSQCDARFGISGELAIPTLPEDDFDAIYSCYAASHYMDATASQPLLNDEGKGQHLRELNQRMTAQKNLTVAQRGGIDDAENEELVLEGLRHAFSQGNMMNYVAACDARYRGR